MSVVVAQKSGALAEATTRFLSGQETQDRVARAFMADSRVTGMIGAAAKRMGLINLRRELVQDALVTFHEKYLSQPGALRLPQPDSVYSLVFAIAENVALIKHRDLEQLRPGAFSLDDLRVDEDGDGYDEQSLLMVDVEDMFEERCLRQVDHNRACAEFEKREGAAHNTPMNRIILPIIGPTEVIYSDFVKDAPRPPKPRRVPGESSNRTPSPDHLELIKIREDIGMTIENFAQALSINEPRLASYIYIRTDTVPEEVMAAARELHRQHMERYEAQKQRFESKSMEQIVDEWLQLLRIEKDPDEYWMEVLASHVLPVTATTVRRWLKQIYRPPLRKIAAYDNEVQDKVKTWVGTASWAKAIHARPAKKPSARGRKAKADSAG